jgi:hypothetical protein
MSGLTPRLMAVIAVQGHVEPDEKNHMICRCEGTFGYFSIENRPWGVCDDPIDVPVKLIGPKITPFADLAPITPTLGQGFEKRRPSATTGVNAKMI